MQSGSKQNNIFLEGGGKKTVTCYIRIGQTHVLSNVEISFHPSKCWTRQHPTVACNAGLGEQRLALLLNFLKVFEFAARHILVVRFPWKVNIRNHSTPRCHIRDVIRPSNLSCNSLDSQILPSINNTKAWLNHHTNCSSSICSEAHEGVKRNAYNSAALTSTKARRATFRLSLRK